MTLESRLSSVLGLVREQAEWNRQNLAQGRVRAFVSAWLDVRGARNA